MKVALKITHNGKVIEHILTLGAMISVGRSSLNEFQLDDDKISGRHCRFFLRKDKLEITDLDSKNGTYLNGIRIDHSELFVGDEVKIGETTITLEEKNSDAEALDILTFPGPKKDRLSYELKADFTGARIQNQLNNKRLSVVPKYSVDAGHAKEIDLRKKIQSRIRLSKQEIRSRNKLLSFFSLSIDTFLMFIVLCLPILIILKLVPAEVTKEQKMLFLLLLEGAFIVVYTFTNFKMARFTVGEKISGVEKLYLEQ